MCKSDPSFARPNTSRTPEVDEQVAIGVVKFPAKSSQVLSHTPLFRDKARILSPVSTTQTFVCSLEKLTAAGWLWKFPLTPLAPRFFQSLNQVTPSPLRYHIRLSCPSVKKRFEPAGAEGVVSTTTVSIEGQRVPRQTEVGVGVDGLAGVTEFGEEVVVDPVGVDEDPLLIQD
jgi:hypothetical protein